MFKQKFAIKTLNTILIENQTAPFLSKESKLVALGVLKDNGYILSPLDLVQFLADETEVSVKTAQNILESVKAIKGANVQHSILIGSFPIKDPDQWGRSLTGFINCLSQYFLDIPDMLTKTDKELYQLSENINYTYLALSTNIDEDIKQLFTTKIPLSLDHEEFVTALYAAKDPVIAKIDASTIVLKEILARHVAMQLTTSQDVSAKNAIDVMRAIALMSGEPNAKLDNQFKIKSLTNPVRRKVIETLDKVANIDDVASKKGLFKKLFKLLHVHESKYSQFENIRALATQLQTINNPKTSRTELYKLVNGIGTEEGFDIILSNPSLFIRNLDAILRKHDSKAVLDLFKMSLQTRDVETKLLVQILEHFRNRDVDLTSRSFILKGKANPVVVDKSLEALSSDVIGQLNSIILEELKRQYSKSENYFAKAYIDPQLYKINIPKSLSAQDGIKIVSRGSRYKFNGDGDVIRMFVHWKASVDIDLSAILFDEDYKNVGSVNFGNVSGEYWEHSGDVRSAPNGGSEFIDFELNKLPENVRYLGMTVNCYSGQAYDDIPELFGGFMIREDRLAGKAFDARTVEDKFSIAGGQDFKLCVLFDVQTREVIMMNTAVDSGAYWSVHSVSFEKQIKAILDRKYVTVGELLELHTDYVLCEDEQLTMSQEELEKVVIFGEDYGFNVVDITSNLL